MIGWFVTGTDTGVGKTTVGMALLQAAVGRGLRAAAMKPVETGCADVDGQLRASDCDRLTASASPEFALPYAVVCPYRFAPPVAPSVAARAAGCVIELDVVARAHAQLLSGRPDVVLIEGAGGLMVPLDDHGHSFVDLARALGYPLVVVARDRLGAINHTLLTLAAARQHGLAIAGVVLDVVDANEVVPSNADELRRAGVPLLGCLPQLAQRELGGHDLGAIAEGALDLAALFGAPR